MFRNDGGKMGYRAITALAGDHQVKPNTKPTGHHQGFRLNKHFQPETLVSFDQPVVKSPVEFISCRSGFPYSDSFIPSSFLKAQALRGPPPMNDLS
ncbi:MAG TPA: hypothetical protein VHC50_12380 [Puia sp.]|nr:hypothetical protein [Puia sp.]